MRVIGDLTLDQLNEIPAGFNNNIAWNFAHLVVTQQLLCYRLSGKDCLIADAVIDRFKKGTAPDPENPMREAEFETFKKLAFDLIDQAEKDYKSDFFGAFKPYLTSMNVELNTIEDAVNYVNIHEGIHFGYIMALKRVISQ